MLLVFLQPVDLEQFFGSAQRGQVQQDAQMTRDTKLCTQKTNMVFLNICETRRRALVCEECEDQGCSLLFIENHWCLWQHDEEGSMSIVTCYVSNCLAMMSSNACERQKKKKKKKNMVF